MREIQASTITDVVEKLCIEANYHLPEDVKCAITGCRACEDGEIAKGVLDKIVEKEYGVHVVKPDFALDYVKMNLFNHKKMVLMPTLDTKETYLIEILEKYVVRSMEERIYDIYVYGMLYENGLGIHDVHMNQGSKGRYRHRDREWSDGAIFFHNRRDLSWTAVFLAFKNQSFKK